jgi:hypothetical protein
MTGVSRRMGALVAGLLLAACAPVAPEPDTAGDPVSSSPPAPEVTGRVVVFDHGDQRVVAVGGDAGSETLVDDAVAADLSADGRWLAYVTRKGKLVRRDLATGADTPIPLPVLPGEDCLAWSPGQTRLTFQDRDGRVYVSTVDGTLTTVDVPKQQRYVEVEKGFILPGAGAASGGVTLVSELTCGRWLDERRLVFDRVADMPGTFTVEDDEPTWKIPVTTTTVALLDPLRLVDAPDRWRVDDRCGDRVLTFVGEQGGERYVVTPASVPDEALTRPGAVAPADGKLPPARAAFIDGSCDVLLLAGAAGEWHPTSRYSPGTRKVEKLRPTYDDDHNPPALDAGTVAFSPDGSSWAVADEETLYLFSLETGGSTFSSGAGLVSKVLGWLPS